MWISNAVHAFHGVHGSRRAHNMKQHIPAMWNCVSHNVFLFLWDQKIEFACIIASLNYFEYKNTITNIMKYIWKRSSTTKSAHLGKIGFGLGPIIPILSKLRLPIISHWYWNLIFKIDDMNWHARIYFATQGSGTLSNTWVGHKWIWKQAHPECVLRFPIELPIDLPGFTMVGECFSARNWRNVTHNCPDHSQGIQICFATRRPVECHAAILYWTSIPTND